ncbi:hypothetical protein JB92DRAFT_3103611 [Gautieria morchelliformis]|nr:hypothetical protein JB92DRAFT_3103611 [Gautieria morchelliformis]
MSDAQELMVNDIDMQLTKAEQEQEARIEELREQHHLAQGKEAAEKKAVEEKQKAEEAKAELGMHTVPYIHGCTVPYYGHGTRTVKARPHPSQALQNTKAEADKKAKEEHKAKAETNKKWQAKADQRLRMIIMLSFRD